MVRVGDGTPRCEERRGERSEEGRERIPVGASRVFSAQAAVPVPGSCAMMGLLHGRISDEPRGHAPPALPSPHPHLPPEAPPTKEKVGRYLRFFGTILHGDDGDEKPPPGPVAVPERLPETYVPRPPPQPPPQVRPVAPVVPVQAVAPVGRRRIPMFVAPDTDEGWPSLLPEISPPGVVRAVGGDAGSTQPGRCRNVHDPPFMFRERRVCRSGALRCIQGAPWIFLNV